MISKHDHVGYMLFDDDWCGCKFPECNQQWKLDPKKGWIPIDEDGRPQTTYRPDGYNKPTYKKKVKATAGRQRISAGR
jgi:hypothetical protein